MSVRSSDAARRHEIESFQRLALHTRPRIPIWSGQVWGHTPVQRDAASIFVTVIIQPPSGHSLGRRPARYTHNFQASIEVITKHAGSPSAILTSQTAMGGILHKESR